MKGLLVLCLAVTAILADLPDLRNYHETIGIPLAAKIKAAEEAGQSGMKIIGGQPAPLGQHPYLVGLMILMGSGSISVCGSSMLSNTKAITAAHCWVDFSNQSQMFTLVFGSQYIFSGGVRVDTTNVEVHSGWSGNFALEFDLAIVTFNHVAYTDIIQPINLPSGALETESFAGWLAQASGYGMIGDGMPLVPMQFQSFVTLQVITNAQCHAFYSPMFVTDRILCTSGQGPVGVCSSDSGGPLSVVYNEQRVLIGVVSFGGISCEAGLPSGFVRVTEHLPWIRQRM